MSGPRNYTQNTLKRLYGLSGNQCAFPGCGKQLVNESNAANSNVCHIEAAELGGQRYNKDMTDQMRADYPNLIALCPSHHIATNDESIYTVDKFKAMKAEHESMIQHRLFSNKPLNSRPSLLAEIVKRMSKMSIEAEAADTAVKAFDIDAKISYNQVIRYRSFIEAHVVYAGKLQKIYTEYERAGKSSMTSVLRTITSLYAKQKGKILGTDLSLTNTQNHADALIEAVERDLHDLMDSSPNNDLTIPYEEVEFGLSIILVDGFMRCKILEEPQ
jgi:hypothetical protein